MTPEELSKIIKESLESLIAAGKLEISQSPEIKIERPKNKEHGDYSCNIALVVAKPAGKNPRDIAQLFVDKLGANPSIKKIEIAGPGFLNFTLDSKSMGEVAKTILQQADQYGHTNSFNGETINIEFISANPTGPLHLGHTRWAAVGDALARVLAASGAKVVKEFYINDRGAQIDKFGISICAAANNEPIPEDGYHGAYVKELAIEITKDKPQILKLSKQ